MKKVLLLSVLLLLHFAMKSQVAYYDAIKLKEIFSKNMSLNSFKEASNILINYLPPKETDTTLALVQLQFLTNPFIPKEFTQFPIPNSDEAAGKKNFMSAISTVGALDVTNIADGLARFLIKRGREELNVAFFNQLKEFLNDEKHQECKVLFPETIDLLGKIDSYKYAAFLENLRNAFHTDLSNLIIHLNQVIDLPKYEFLANHAEIKLVLGTANIVSELSQAGKSIMPDSVIKQLAVLPWGKLSRNLENSLKFLNLISQSISAQAHTSHQSWVSLSDLNTNLFTDSITLRIYFGLLYQQVKSQNIAFYSKNKDSVRMDGLLGAQKDHIFRLSGLIQNFSLLADDVQNTIGDYQAKKEKGALTNDDNYTYISKAINII
ncbi:MAG: hypothetical protein ABI208_06865, partial [Ginsengibacter sp.]